MKKITALIAAGLCFTGASAQYVSLQQGTTLDYKTVIYQGTDSAEIETKAEVVSVKEADGKITVLTQETTPIPDGPFKEKIDTATVVYTPADKSTTFVLSTEQSARQDMIDMIKMQYQAAGQFVTEGDLSTIFSSIRVKGELTLTVNADMKAGTKLPNKSQRIIVDQQSFSYNIWNAVVEGTETVTVPAGTFECLKVSFVNKVDTQKIYVTQWYAPNIGAVKVIQEMKKGEPMLCQYLTAFNKPQE